jgi:HAD superfamily hydrolase (TIGR01509 family)
MKQGFRSFAMKPKAIIFDMDGTIVDTEKIWQSATNRLLANNGIILSPEAHAELEHQFHGLAIHETCQLIKKVGNLDVSVELLILEKRTIVEQLYRAGEGICLIPGFAEFHASAKQYNLKTGVATNADETTLKTTNELVDLSQFFGEHLYSIACVNNRHKPHPDIYLHAAEKLGVQPHECIAIEDSAHGICAAQAAGMMCIGINTHRNHRQVKDADIIVDTYDAIPLTLLTGSI